MSKKKLVAFLLIYKEGDMYIECYSGDDRPNCNAETVICIGEVPDYLGHLVCVFNDEGLIKDFSRLVYSLAFNCASIELKGKSDNLDRLMNSMRVLNFVLPNGESLPKTTAEMANSIRENLLISFV